MALRADPVRVEPTHTAPYLGFLGATVGGAIAWAAIPANPFAAGALMVPAVAMTLGLMISPIVSFFRQPRSMMRVEHLIMVGLVYWILLDLLQGSIGLTRVSPEGIRGAFVCIAIFAATFWAANFAPAHQLPRFIINSTRHELSPTRTLQIAFICFGLAMLNYLYAADFDVELVVRSLLSNRWNAPWLRGQFGGWESFRDHLQYFGYVVPTLAAVLVVRCGWLNYRSLTCLVMALIILAFLSHGGNRRIVGTTAGAAILYYLLSNTKLTVRQVIFGALLVAGLLVLMQLIFNTRGTGLLRAYLDDDVTLGTGVINVDDNFLRLGQFVDFFPERVPYVTYRRLYYTATRPIPRVFWPDKPINGGFDLAEALGDRGVSWSSSVLADWYMMYGYLAVGLGGFVYGRLCSWWSRVMDLGVTPIGILVYSLGAMAIFCSVRQIDELLLQSYPLMGWFLVSALLLKAKTEESPA